MSIKRGLAATAVVCALLTGAAACGDDGGDKADDPKKPAASESASQSPASGQEPNGVDKLTAKEIFDKSEEAFKTATALRVNGTMGGGGMRLDMAIGDDGVCSGKIAQDGAQVEIIKNADTVWMKLSGAFWRMVAGEEADAAQALVGDRWLMAPADSADAEDFSSMCDIDEFTGSMNEDSSAADTATKGATSTVDGIPVVEIKYTSESDGPTSLFVSTVGKPYPVKMVGTDDGESAEVKFTDYDKPVTITPPAASEVLDYSKIQDLEQSA